VSSKHCVIKYVDGRYFVTDNSTNGVELIVAGIRLGRGNSESLLNGEVMKIGDYEISVRIDIDDAPLCGFDGASIGTAHSFDALMAATTSTAPNANELPSLSSPWEGSVQGTAPDLLDFLTPVGVPAATRPDHLPGEQHDFRPPSVSIPPPLVDTPMTAGGANVIPADWDVVFQAPTPAAHHQTDDKCLDSAHTVAASESIPTPAANVNSSTLLAAFLRGAGLEKLRLDDSHMQTHMELIGRSYRRMVEGLIDILRARSSLKGEFRLQQTLIRPLENNPLKFAPNADEALLLLLRPDNQAFMAPDQAIDDSFDDLRAHQLAVMAGVEASITALLKRFEPARLEARMGDTGAVSRLFGSRQAQCWQRFTELYAAISQEAEDDFPELFGREFGRAYEQHSARSREC
jgi:type VI secretion system protein